MVNSSLRYLLLAVLVLWGLVSLAASAGLYKLWWERERVLYLGQTVAEQRLQVFRLAVHCFARTPPLRRVAVVLFTYILVNGIWVFLMSVVEIPDDWDAWAIWGAKAKVLALGTGPLTDVALLGHPDYPLLWPALWAFSGWLAGGWEEMWSKGWGAVLLMLCAWEIAVIIKRLTGPPTLALLGAALLVSMPMVTVIASWGYAETPFWLMLTACAGCLSLRENSPSPVVLAVAAAYTKNEGVLFAGVAVLWLLVLPGRNRLGAMLLFAGIIVACYLPWLSWKHFVLQAGSHATAGLHFDPDSILRAWQRLAPASGAILKMWADPRQWNIVLWLCGASLLVGVYRGVRRAWLLPPTVICLVYLLIILFHEAEIYWQVGTAWNRLTVHFLPFLIVYLTLQFSVILNPDKGKSYDLPLNMELTRRVLYEWLATAWAKVKSSLT